MDFYKISEDYICYLQEYEKEKRGVTKVPNIRYTDRNKFAFGAVLKVGDILYYVSVSSYDKKQESNILIRIPGDKKEVKGSLRFNYMVSVPKDCLERVIIKNIADEKYRFLLNKEYRFCIDNQDKIVKKAQKIYDMVVENRKQVLSENSCDFKILEEAYLKYIETKQENS